MSYTGVVLAGRYRLDVRIAVGRTGEVWRAADSMVGLPVAVKLIRAEYAGHPSTLARFRTEARHASALAHPGIIRVYEFGEADPAHPPYVVMELVDGPSLADVLADGQVDPARAMDIVAQAATGLDVAHAVGLVHRDIKPANLLLGPAGRVKITDFGLSAGTPGYLAPERVMGGSATAASDVYALGVVAYECLAGAPPFSGTESEVAAAHRELPLPPLPPVVPGEVAGLVSELTAKDPAARPAAGQVARRAAQLRGALAAGVALPGAWPDQPTVTLSIPPTDLPSARRPLGRDKVWPARAAVAAVAATAVTAGTAGWLLAGVFGAQPSQPRAAGPSVTSAPGRPAAAAPESPPVAAVVNVDGGSLPGQPVAVVRQRLRQLGLVVRVLWQPASGQHAGTVVSVSPAGQVPVGSLVVVTAAATPPGHRHDNGGD